MTFHRIKTCAVCASAGLLFATSALAEPTFTGLGFLPGGLHFSSASGISADGSTVIGIGALSDGTKTFRWTRDEGFSGLGELPGGFVDSRAISVDADGSTIVGLGFSIDSSGGGRYRAFRWSIEDGMVDIGDPPESLNNDFATGVSDDGSTITGFQSTNDSAESFRWTASGGRQGLGFLPGGSSSYSSAVSGDSTTIVGDGETASGHEAFRWTESEGMVGLGDLPGGSNSSSANDVNADGAVIVGSSISSQGSEAFRWTATDGMVGLGVLFDGHDLPENNLGSSAFAVSADGTIVLGASDTANGIEAFLWTQQDGMRRLADVLTEDYGLDLTGWILQDTRGISADNTTIVGGGFNPNGDYEAFIARIPTPGAAMLLGLGGLAVMRRRRR